MHHCLIYWLTQRLGLEGTFKGPLVMSRDIFSYMGLLSALSTLTLTQPCSLSLLPMIHCLLSITHLCCGRAGCNFFNDLQTHCTKAPEQLESWRTASDYQYWHLLKSVSFQTEIFTPSPDKKNDPTSPGLITELQTGFCWKGPLKVIQLNPPAMSRVIFYWTSLDSAQTPLNVSRDGTSTTSLGTCSKVLPPLLSKNSILCLI